ncbi:FtsH protease activity modulator HflK [Marinospirillum alkaliphilum]|uniref:Protein HflK n=1 Tax=Marinospirillum alkaliphilum DSM 21637 TaxID=1122209 RepID=A0A1K1W2A3_9GAMM|nr:FtsH protease activity modulator HflK [Marinospirillum alkaliphilum]SFX31327.1 protease FtsH subunit HflK [Marinospirillum alkaliphilum DSM 21637]
MAWNEPGGSGNQHDPWSGGGRKPDRNSGNNGGGQGPNQGPPDLDEALKKLQDKLGGVFGGKGGGGSGSGKPAGKFGGYGLTALVAILVLAIWFASGFYLIDQSERGVVLRLGKYHETVTPGLHWNPPIIDSVTKVNVTRIRSFNQRATMLTRDENIVQVAISVQYVISDPKAYLLNVRAPERSLEYALDSSLRHEVGTTNLIQILTEGREILATGVNERLQRYLSSYGVGITLQTVNIESTSAPDEVQSAFDDVIRAREDRERSINQARAYENSILPEAEGRAARIREEAQAYREAVTARADGESTRFLALLTEYRRAPAVTRERLYIDTMQEVLSNTSKVLVDTEEGSNNLLYLPLDRMGAGAPAGGGATAPRSSGQSGQTADFELEQLTDRVIERIRERQNTTTTIRREGR